MHSITRVVARNSNVWIDGTDVRGPAVGGFDTAPGIDTLNSTLVVQSSVLVGGTSQPIFHALEPRVAIGASSALAVSGAPAPAGLAISAPSVLLIDA
jgi:hypothetical protein